MAFDLGDHVLGLVPLVVEAHAGNGALGRARSPTTSTDSSGRDVRVACAVRSACGHLVLGIEDDDVGVGLGGIVDELVGRD